MIARAPWREAKTYRSTWPHEYVLIRKDKQQALLEAFCERIRNGEGIDGKFVSKSFTYLFYRGVQVLDLHPLHEDRFGCDQA